MKVDNPASSGKASGKALGGVFSFNRGLPTFKKYVPARIYHSEIAREIKNRFSYLTKYWKTELTFEQITAWNEWVLPWTDIYGKAVTLAGINKFCICNDTLHKAGRPISVDPPPLTPSELTFSSFVESQYLHAFTKGVPDAEIEAQSPFIKCEIAVETYTLEQDIYKMDFAVVGRPISRKILEKNYVLAGFIDCREIGGGDEDIEFTVLTDTVPHIEIAALRLQRFNKWGFWSAPVVLTGPIWYE